MFENTFILNIINTPSHALLVNTHEFALIKEILHLINCHDKIANVNIPFNKNIEFGKQRVNVGEDDVYFYYITKKNQLMNGIVPWRGTCEKYAILI